jgi:TPR repeat protein
MNAEVLKERLRAILPWNTFWQHNIGARYATGDGVEKDEHRAALWYRRAARRGHAESQYDLGFMYLVGEGIAVDVDQGLSWLELAARQGHDEAAAVLAEAFGEGRYGVPMDDGRATLWRSVAKSSGA